MTRIRNTLNAPSPAPMDEASLPIGPSRRIVLIVVDGLGYATLTRLGSGSCLLAHCQGRLSSVFPSTTATAIPAFFTGLHPSRHGITGWHTYLGELDTVAAVLPFTRRGTGASLVAPGVGPEGIFQPRPLFQDLGVDCHVFSPAAISESPFSRAFTQGASRHAYRSLEDCFTQLRQVLLRQEGPCFHHVYWPTLDATAHDHGIQSPQVAATFARLEEQFARFLKAIAGSDTTVILSADHGFIDSPQERHIQLADHPELAHLLAQPLCGEPRVAYCYLKPGAEARFESYITEHLCHAMEAHASLRLMAAGRFGPPPFHPRLAQRIGDYTLILKDNWTLWDYLPGEVRSPMIGVHGGISEDEMSIPLVIAHP